MDTVIQKQDGAIELRYTVRELRADPAGEGRRVVGYAAIYNSLSEDLGGFIERIRPGAFARTLRSADVRALMNHDRNYVIGRNKAGTLELVDDEVGLRIAADAPDTQWARDMLTSIRRGDIDQMSFTFRAIRDEWTQVEDQLVRTLIDVDLYDVSVVTFPAYPQTSVNVRSIVDRFRESGGVGLAGLEPEPGRPADPMDQRARARQVQRARRLAVLLEKGRG